MNGLTRCPLSCPLSLESAAMGTSTFCLFMSSERLMKVVLPCQNQDALRSALRRPATSQNNAGSDHPNCQRSVFRQETHVHRSAPQGSESCLLVQGSTSSSVAFDNSGQNADDQYNLDSFWSEVCPMAIAGETNVSEGGVHRCHAEKTQLSTLASLFHGTPRSPQ